MKKIFISLQFLVLSTLSFSQVQLGKRAPEIVIKEWMQPEQRIPFHGKPLVIDFWATWCAPCIASFPLLDQVAQQYAGKINFIAISDEDATRVKRFMQTPQKPHISLVLDENGQTFSNFNISSRPTTAFIDEKGVLQWMGTSDQLQTVLGHYFRNKRIPESLSSAVGQAKTFQENRVIGKKADTANSLFSFTVKKSLPGTPFTARRMNGGDSVAASIKVTALTPKALVLDHLPVSSSRVRINTHIPIDTLDVELTSFTTAIHPLVGDRIIAESIAAMYDLKLSEKDEQTDAWIISVGDGEKLKKFESTLKTQGQMLKRTGKGYNAINCSLDFIASIMESKYRLLVETGKLGSFKNKRFNIKDIPGRDFLEVSDFLRSIGLKIEKVTKPVTFIEINSSTQRR
ncbi:MAG TPA: TlpA disulfide reductase family protein [Sphingobacteriaceae bacterium]